MRKVSLYTHETYNFAIKYSCVYMMVIYGFMEENGIAPLLLKTKLGSPNTEGPQEI